MRKSVWRPTADEIAEMVDSGRDIARFFADQGTVKQTLTSISVDITQERSEGHPQGARPYRPLRCVSAARQWVTGSADAPVPLQILPVMLGFISVGVTPS